MTESALRDLLNSLEASRSSLHVLLHIFTGLVVIGLAIDLLVVIKEFRDDWKEFRFGEVHPYENHLPKRPSISLLILALLGTALIVLGVAGEIYVDVQAGKIDSQMRDANDTLLGLIIQEAGNAAQSAKTAHNEAGAASIKARQAEAAAGTALRTSKAANAAAFEAQGNVEEITEQSDVLGRKLWQFESWKSARTLIDPGSFVATLRKFKGKEIVLTSFVEGEDPETFELCNAFFLAASNAEMRAINRCGKEPPSTPPRTGVLVYGTDEKETKEFVEIIANSVTSVGAGGMPPIVGSPLTILVGNQTPFSMDSKELFNPPPIRKKKSRQAKKP